MTINGLKAIVLCWKLFLLIHVYMYIMCHSKVSWGADNSAPSSFSVFFPSLSVSLVVSELISWFISNHLVLTHVRHTCQTVQCLVSVTRGKVNCREQYSLVYSYWTRSSNNVRLFCPKAYVLTAKALLSFSDQKMSNSAVCIIHQNQYWSNWDLNVAFSNFWKCLYSSLVNIRI